MKKEKYTVPIMVLGIINIIAGVLLESKYVPVLGLLLFCLGLNSINIKKR